MDGSHQKLLIERRRRHSDDLSQLVSHPGPSQNRRADDQLRIRSQRWVELADVALRKKPAVSEDGNNH